MYQACVVYQGITYPSVEHAYQASKIEDHQTKLMMTRVTAVEAKLLGKQMPMRKNFNQLRPIVMQHLVFLKFFGNEELGERLLKESVLVEYNYWGDRYWGVDQTGEGLNILGTILQSVQQLIKSFE